MKYFVWLILTTAFLVKNVTALANNVPWGYTCYERNGSTIITNKCSASGATEDKAKAAAFCHGPNNSQANNTFTEYGCGKCPKGAKNGTTCISCPAWNSDSENSNCNKPTDPIFTYSCYQGGVPVKCNNGSGTQLKNIHCWGPKPTYTGNNLNLTTCGCGTCEEAHAANPTAGWKLDDCSTCNYNNCNGATEMMSALAFLLAIYWLCV